MRNPIFLSPQVICQMAPPATSRLEHEILQTVKRLLMQQSLQFGHGHRDGSVHEPTVGRQSDKGPEVWRMTEQVNGCLRSNAS